MADQLVSIRDAAEQIGRTEESLRWLIRTGRGPESVFIDGRRMFRQSRIDAYIESASSARPNPTRAPSRQEP